MFMPHNGFGVVLAVVGTSKVKGLAPAILVEICSEVVIRVDNLLVVDLALLFRSPLTTGPKLQNECYEFNIRLGSFFSSLSSTTAAKEKYI